MPGICTPSGSDRSAGAARTTPEVACGLVRRRAQLGQHQQHDPAIRPIVFDEENRQRLRRERRLFRRGDVVPQRACR